MNTDKNGWPYVVGAGGIIISAVIINSYDISNTYAGFLGFILVIFWWQVMMFLNLLFSETLKFMPIYKKLIISLCPFLYYPMKDWFLERGEENGSKS